MSPPFTAKTETKRSESSIEKAACKKAVAHGWRTYKFKSTVRGVPDRIFLKKGAVVFVEFKAEGGRLTPLQKITIDSLREGGAWVFVCHSPEELMQSLDGVADAAAF
jgi:hypothetical protein